MLDSFPEYSDVIRVSEVVVVKQWIPKWIFALKLDSASAFRPKDHGKYTEHVVVIDAGKGLVVKLLGQSVGFLHLLACKGN